MLAELELLDQEINQLQKQLKSLPPGKLVITKNQSRCKWYVNDGSHLTYLPKSQKILAEKLASQKYISLRLEELIHEKQAINFYLRHHAQSSCTSQKLLLDSSYHLLLAPFFQQESQEILNWSTASYNHNPNFPDQLVHKSPSGHMVRSKSEVYIDNALYKAKIPFRYEYELTINELTFYPDFTILHPQTKKIYYWEHFGMMENLSYSKKAYSKLQIYNENNIIPSMNLILTFETKENPLSIQLVEQIIDNYFR